MMSRAQVSEAMIQASPSRPEHERPHPQRIANADHIVLANRHQRPGALDLPHRLDQPVQQPALTRAGDQVDDDLGVGGRLEQRALVGQAPAQHRALVRLPLCASAKPPRASVGEQRLDVAQHAPPVVA